MCPIRILIFANAPFVPSGYGTQAAQLGRTLRAAGHDVAFACYYGLHGTCLNWDGFVIYPASGESDWSMDVLPGHYQHWRADLLITLMDIWVLDPAVLRQMNVAHWMPVDAAPLSSMDRTVLQQGGGRPVAMSRHGERMLTEAGFSPLYAPHALDTVTWSPLDRRDDARRQLGFDGKFVIGVNAANQDPSRKGFGEQLQAFARFAKRHDDARMIIHTRVSTRQGADIGAMIRDLGLDGKAMPGDQYAIACGLVTEPMMVSWHGVMDVLSNCSWGEGFGLPVLQSQACGVPVIVTDSSAMTELCGAGWKVRGQRYWHRAHNAWWVIPEEDQILRAYEKAYEHAGDPRMRDKARRFALGYDAKTVYEQYWAPVLGQLAPAKRKAAPLAGPRIFAPVMFRDETDMLAMRLAETDGLVDRHVIVEAPVTHRMVPKPLAYAKAGKKLAKYTPKIAHVVTGLPGDSDPWVNEHAQRDAAWPVIDSEAADSDWVLICDVDEIPSPSLLERLRKGDVPGEVAAVRMRVFLHAVDWEVPAAAVPPQCVVATAGYIRRHGGKLSAVRDGRLSYPVLEDGGWHFSWQGGPEVARAKLETATCHTELLGTAEGDAIADGTRYRTADGGTGLPAVPVDVDETWPAWIRDRRCPPEWFRPRETVPA